MAAVCLLLTGGYAQGQNVDFTEYDLANGMHVILQQDNTLPIVSVGVMYKVGQNQEPTDAPGVISLIEGIVTHSTANLSVGDFRRYLGEYAGAYNFDVKKDYTFFCETFSSNLFGLGLWLEAEKMRGIHIDPESFACIRNHVYQQYLGRENDLKEAEYNALMKLMFNDSRYTQDPEKIKEISLGLTIDFYGRYFVPSNATLVLCGRFDMAQAREYIDAYFGPLVSGQVAGAANFPKVQAYEKEKYSDTLYTATPKRSIIFAWKVPGVSDPSYDKIRFINTILCEGKRSRLYKKLVDDLEVATDVESNLLSLSDESVFGIRVQLAKGSDVYTVLPYIRGAVMALQDDYVSESELAKAKNNYQSANLSSYSSRLTLAGLLAYNYLFYKDTEAVNSKIVEITNIYRDELVYETRDYLREDNMKILYILPKIQLQP